MTLKTLSSSCHQSIHATTEAYHDFFEQGQEPYAPERIFRRHGEAGKQMSAFHLLFQKSTIVEEWNSVYRDPDALCEEINNDAKGLPKIIDWKSLALRKEWDNFLLLEKEVKRVEAERAREVKTSVSCLNFYSTNKSELAVPEGLAANDVKGKHGKQNGVAG